MIERTPISHLPLLAVPERERRPNLHEGGVCPFCPGAEDHTPPEILRDGNPWRIRLFPNKYPASERHEVLVESANHGQGFSELGIDHARSVMAISFERYHQLRTMSPFVTLFKNHGQLAGASIPHPHSQILATPFAPARVETETRAFADSASCPLCDLSAHPQIAESADYRWIAPIGSTMPWQQWIVPRRHANEMDQTGDLAPLLQSAVRATREIAPAFNWAFLNFPGEPRAHWYLELFPRLTTIAGFELGSGTFINTVDPIEAARVLQTIHDRRSD